MFTKYLKVALKEMGYRLMQQCQVSKRLAHRKQVLLDEEPSPCKQICRDDQLATSSEEATCADGAIPTQNSATAKGTQCVLCHAAHKTKTRFLWIQCTACKNWVHRKCDASLKSKSIWSRMIKRGTTYSCPLCLNAVNNLALTWHGFIKH